MQSSLFFGVCTFENIRQTKISERVWRVKKKGNNSLCGYVCGKRVLVALVALSHAAREKMSPNEGGAANGGGDDEGGGNARNASNNASITFLNKQQSQKNPF